MKFYCAEGPAVARFERECAIFERFQEPYLKAEASNYLPAILDVYQSDSAVTGSAGDALPPCLIQEQGAYSLLVRPFPPCLLPITASSRHQPT